MPYPCFLIEKTGNTRTREVVNDCTTPNCSCGGVYTYTDYEWRRTDTGETLWGDPNDFGVGAMFWVESHPYGDPPKYMDWDNHPGKHLTVITPGGYWNIDSRASNCTRPEDRSHRCWIRHGEPPNIHVDKNGDTCQAGAGSIMCGNYHGFLHNGVLTDQC